MCQQFVKLFAEFRERNRNSQGYSTNNAGKPVKGTTQLLDLQDSVNFINEKFQEQEQDS